MIVKKVIGRKVGTGDARRPRGFHCGDKGIIVVVEVILGRDHQHRVHLQLGNEEVVVPIVFVRLYLGIQPISGTAGERQNIELDLPLRLDDWSVIQLLKAVGGHINRPNHPCIPPGRIF